MGQRSYAVWWTLGDGARHAGKIEVVRRHVLLSGNATGRLAVPLEEINSIDYASGELMVRRQRGASIRIGSLDAPGALLELTEALRHAA